MTDATRSPLELAWTAPHEASVDDWPHPTTVRWQPLRLGLVDLYYYDDEQFWFHDGRLLLRGNNGTGKSKVLALTLPFLLDGSLHPRRVEPDADPKKRMEWNLLLGGAHSGSERTGYTWVEFGRLDADGTEHFTTLGIGLKAATGRGIVKTWYFVTTRRVGDLRLVDGNRVALTAERLRDELAEAGSGQVFSTQEAYRRAVDEALFHLGEERYAALIDLLIQLRQPQLSKKPDGKMLSAALTEALSPLDQAVVADVAESFRSLEEERVGVADTKGTLAATDDFLGHYSGYAKVASRRRTTAVRESNSEYEWAGRNLREAEAALTAVADQIGRLDADKQDADARRSALQGEDHALRESPEMRDAYRLDRARREAEDAQGRENRAGAELARASDRAERERRAAVEAGAQWENAAGEHRSRSETAARLAGPAGLDGEHPGLVAAEDAAHRAVARRREQIAHLRRVVDQVHRARERVERSREALDTAQTGAVDRAQDAQLAEAAVESAIAGHGSALGRYLNGLRMLTVEADAAELVDQATEWARRQNGSSPAKAAVDAALATALSVLGREQAAAEHDRQRIDDELASVRAQIADLEAGHDPEPPPGPTRDRQVRAGVAGAPLWRLTDFEGTTAPDTCAGLEAALQSAGLLDAWVFPDGTVTLDGDVVLGPGGPVVQDADASLVAVMTPSVGPDEPVPAEAIRAVLARIGLGESSGAPLWVDGAGRWGAGPARGSWSKANAEYVGAGAREANRRARLEARRGLGAGLEQQRAQAQARVEAVEEHARQAREESARYPGHTERELSATHAGAASAQRELARAQQAVTEAQARWVSDEREAAGAQAELADEAAQLRLGTTVADLDAVASAVDDYALALTEVRGAARILADKEISRDEAVDRATEAEEIHDRRAAELSELGREASSLRARYEALAATVGASVAELQERLGHVADQLRDVAAELETIAAARLDAAASQGTLRQKVEGLEQQRQVAAVAREQKVSSLHAFAATGLLRVAVPELSIPDHDRADEWTITAALALSRLAEQQLEDCDESDDAWSRSQQRVSSAATELQTQMSRHGHAAFVEQRDDVMVARVRYLGDEVDVDQLGARLVQDVADRERLLSEREREILENHLVNEVAGHLHELLLAAESQIDEMNRELAARKTSTGIALRVKWRERTDGPAGLTDTRALMLRSDATWTASDRAAIGGFLQARIADIRQTDPSGGWQEHLEQALDYRQWHSFTVERLQNGQWRSVSGPASSGENALAVSVPLFAAASTHYNSAVALAPRLILLDEAFVGVDDDSRAKTFGLLATFDLDVVMTSEREWGCYPQVPGLSIAQLSRVEGVEAVGVTRWRWDGRRRERMGEVADETRAGGQPTASAGDSLVFD